MTAYLLNANAEALQHSHGQYTKKTVARASVIIGQLGAALDTAFHENVCSTTADASYRHKYDYSADVKAFCTEYRQDRLFDQVQGRHHKSLPNFRRDLCIKDQPKLKSRLLKYSKKLDQSRLM